MRPVHVYGGQPIGPDKTVDTVVIYITEPMPEIPNSPDWADRARAVFAADGAALAEAIWAACPGGTVDALIVALLTRRASLLRVAMPTDPVADQTSTATCEGPLVWFDAGPEEADGAIVECAGCDYLATTGNFHDDAHSQTPIMREGLAHG